MPRNIRWDESVQENVLNLVEALLYQADEELDDLALKAAVQVEWVTANKLRVTGQEKRKRGKRELIVEVGTRKEHLVKLLKKTGKSLKLPKPKEESGSSQQERELEEVQTALDCLKELGVREPKKAADTKGYWKFTLTLKHQTATREENLQVVRQEWKKHPKTNSLVTSSTTPILEIENSIDWHGVCLAMLEKQKQLTTNRLMCADEMLFDIDRICVDLALVERKQTDKRSGDDNPARSQLYKPDYEETQKLEYEDFLTKVLKSEQSKKVAIIGEPGAGKTTLLQRIAFWILENTDDLPIWISLGNFPNPVPKFKNYLLNDWLEDTPLNITPKIKAEFEELLTAGKVWLLLDGVDEMAAKSASPLTAIANRIVGWCDCLRVVLTCRLNVWEANPYSLNGFQTYRALEFSEEKVEEFINACFQKSNPELGIQLQQALNQPGKERIQDLVRNPLRLTLLCSTWHLREGKLPDTKAELYQMFVEEVYRWKKDEFPTTPEQREQLNAKLKELALAAIDKEENRFCLRHKFVESVLGESDGSVFQLTLNIGWLNRVGVDAKNPNPNQPIYAFFHPTFQEYFAALAIDDWDFFLPRAHDNRNPNPVSDRYRIFEPQWKEVILLWLGRPHEEVTKEQKEEFIKALVEFEDGCGGFYRFRAYFLATSGIAEFSDSFRAKEIVAQIVQWGFAEFDVTRKKWVQFLDPIQEGARTALSETERVTAITALVELINKCQNIKYIRNRAAKLLIKLDSCNPTAIAILETLINESPDILEEIIQNIPDGNLYYKEECNSIRSTSENSISITSLVEVINNSQDEKALWQAADSLGKIGLGDPIAIIALVKLINKYQDGIILQSAVNSLGKIGLGNPTAIAALVKLIENENSQDEFTRKLAVNSLGEIGLGNPTAIAALVKLIANSQEQDTCGLAVYNLKEILLEVQMKGVVIALNRYLSDETYKNGLRRYRHCYYLIWHCAENMTYPTFYQAWHQQEGVGETTTPDRQSLNQADLPQSLQSAIANNSQLSQTIHLICINGSQFIEPDRPAAEIYDQMLDQNCPECDSLPETMPALKLYWNSLKRHSNKRPFLVFYASSSNRYSEAFLTVLSKFGREICVIAEQHFEHIPLKFFAPSQTIEDVVKWIRQKVQKK